MPAAASIDLSRDAGYLVMGVLALLPIVPLLWWVRRRGRDEVFTGVTPGEFPGIGHEGGRTRTPGPEYSGPVAVRFTPPEGLTPALVGVVVDGRADPHDLGATIVDLAVRGHYRIIPDTGPPTDDPKAPVDSPTPADSPTPRDYLFVRPAEPPDDPLRPYERILVDGLFARGPQQRLSSLGETFAQRMREATVALYRDVVDRGWYPDHPQSRGRRLGCAVGMLYALLAAVFAGIITSLIRSYDAGPIAYLLPAALLLGSVAAVIWVRRRVPRSAEGSAVRIQTLGFKDYISTAEAGQLRFEEGRDIFSRYLPYAIVFGCAKRWADLAGDILTQRPDLAAVVDLTWFDVVELGRIVGDGFDIISGVSDLAALGADVADLTNLADLGGLADLGEGAAHLGDALGGLAESAGGVASGIGELLSGASDGCSGCDLPGCDL